MNKEEMNDMFYENVKMACKLRRIPLGSLEKNAGMPVGALSRHKNISLHRAMAIARVLDVKVDDLVSERYNKFLKNWGVNAEIKTLKEEIEELRKKLV